MDDITRVPIVDDAISFRDVVELWWQSRLMVIVVTAICTLLAGGVGLVLPKKYEALIVISPVSTTAGSGQGGGGISSMLSEFGGLASLAGLSVGGDSRKAEFVTVLQSALLTTTYIKNNNLLPVLFYKQWDTQNQRWKPLPADKMPTLWKANEFFRKKVRKINTDSKTGIVTMGVTWTDPQLAADWANGLVKMANEYLRNKAITLSDRNIAYLNEQAAKTDLVGARQAISSLLQTEINKQMLARGNEEYAFKVLDPAMPPERPTTPPPLLLVLGGLLGGLMLTTIIVFSRLAWRRSA
jgi:uncharacterized protein involved in exopolysaccharide biosynthesis